MENGSKPATQADLQAAKADLKSDVAAVRVEFRDAKTELRGEIQAVKSELKADIAGLDKKIEKVAIEVFKRLDDCASKSDITAINHQLGKMTNILDTIAGEVTDNRRTLLVFDKILGKNRETLEDHEGRIKTLESRS